jgi:hypothetical protein
MAFDWLPILVPLLQIEGGLFYLGHKVFTWKFEQTENNTEQAESNKWLIWAWTSYLIGTPGIIGAFLIQHNWIFAALEFGGIPMMVLGLRFARRGMSVDQIKPEMKRLEPILWVSIVVGIGYSLWYFGTLLNFTQLLEIGGSGAYLVGSLLQAKKQNGPAYRAYLIMIIVTGTLCGVERMFILAVQQVISFGFVYASYKKWASKQAGEQK